ncbi:MAG: hypothetical protein AAFY11_16090, partial [Cyanobacteria bacterium J06641_5]
LLMDPPIIRAVIDYCSTGPRSVYSLASEGQPHLCSLDSHVIELSRSSIEQYQAHGLGAPFPEDAAWVSLGDRSWALGHLAAQTFGAPLRLEPLKVEHAIYQTLAIVGAIAQRQNLPSRLVLKLGALLPFGEYQGREVLRGQLATALADFSFRGRNYTCTLEDFEALPEGAGILYGTAQENISASVTGSVGILCLGFRNDSQLVVERGKMRGRTGDFGFSFVTKRVQAQTSGQYFDNPQLIAAASKSTPVKRKQALSRLARSTEAQFRQPEIAQLVEAVEAARQDYLQLVAQRCHDFFTANPSCILLGGGTAWHCRSDLRTVLHQFFPRGRTRLDVGKELLTRCDSVLGPQLKRRGLAPYR